MDRLFLYQSLLDAMRWESPLLRKGNRRTQTFVNDALESYKTHSLAIIEPEVPTPADIYSAHGRPDNGVKTVKAYV